VYHQASKEYMLWFQIRFEHYIIIVGSLVYTRVLVNTSWLILMLRCSKVMRTHLSNLDFSNEWPGWVIPLMGKSHIRKFLIILNQGDFLLRFEVRKIYYIMGTSSPLSHSFLNLIFLILVKKIQFFPSPCMYNLKWNNVGSFVHGSLSISH